MKRKISLFVLAIIASILILPNAGAGEKWRFITLSDWHSAEKYIHVRGEDYGSREKAVKEDIAAAKMLKDNYGGEFVFIPGDSNGGHWDTKRFRNNYSPNLSPEETVLKAGHYCYEGMINAFAKGGYDKIIMAVGDHEMGDNPWPAGSMVSKLQPEFRESFAKEFNYDENGEFIYDEPIGEAPSRPLGTKYQDTSYAYQHKNVLFITVDEFHQENPNKRIGGEGSVTGTVTGKHLDWLRNVLSEANKDSSIKHIFVQGHLPVIYPVRKVNSSGMMMDDNDDNPFWKVLREYGADLYFAGEVHANTVTKDSKSDLIQLVSRGNFFTNFLTLDITDDLIDINLYENPKRNVLEGSYSKAGSLVIDKSDEKTRFKGEGMLDFVDIDARLFHFDFEELSNLHERPIFGLRDREIRGIKTTTETIPNKGEFGVQYDAVQANVSLEKTEYSGKAGRFTEKSRMACYGMGPLQNEHAVSYAVRVKTESPEKMVLINTGSIWGSNVRNFLNLNLNNGLVQVEASKSSSLLARSERLNDSKWHHIAAVMPEDGCQLSEVLVYVDGKKCETKLKGADTKLYFNQAVRLSFGGLGYSKKAFDSLGVSPFIGMMDDISVWTRPLKQAEAESLAEQQG
ncbi:Laminin G domain protein [Sedimentisphaera cyanobacteriorum]|uniref:Laminin G domain protein n=1 Tax=Sedimentisphaera cyanobacteriorum TaxID=1940790 RepID=A0A1Q2HRN6_9BACT|nr:LamG domain-containing protein [Sedimentisphaera cyanobacteriorum]AQQ09934.1 Laminin G domain protein [Sedimentisphaera cyanobacteriorum]